MTDTKTLSRRQIMAGAAGVGVLWAVDAPALARKLFGSAPRKPPATAAASVSAAMPAATAIADVDSHWAANVGKQFYLDGPAGTVMMTLLSVAPVESGGVRPPDVPRKRAFALRFDTGRVNAPTVEKIYTVYGPSTGATPLFLSPSAIVPNTLTAVFN